MQLTYNDARLAYKKFKKKSRGFFWMKIRKRGKLKSFYKVQNENSAFSSTDIGIKEVPLNRILGSVQKFMYFDKNFVPRSKAMENIWIRNYYEYINGNKNNLVELYKIKDEYFVCNGNHLVSIFKYLKLKKVEAVVKEFIPSSDTKENIIYREKFIFEKKTGISDIEFTETTFYDRVIKEIEDFIKIIKEKQNRELNLEEASSEWKEKILDPILEIIKQNKLNLNFKNRTNYDIFIFFLNHKYFESEKMNSDTGFLYAIINFISVFNIDKNNLLENKFILDINVKHALEKIEYFDRKKILSKELLRRNLLIKDSIGIDFDYNFIILYEINEFLEKNNIKNEKEGIKEWGSKYYFKYLEVFKEKLDILLLKNKNILEFLLKDKYRLFISIYNFSLLKNIDFFDEKEIVNITSNYISDLLITITYNIDKKNVKDEDILESYFEIINSYIYLNKDEEKYTLKEIIKLYFENKKKSKNIVLTLLNIKNKINTENELEKIISLFKNESKNEEDLEDIFKFYGYPEKEETIYILKKCKENYESKTKGLDWIKEKLEKDLQFLECNEEIISFYKTKDILIKYYENEYSYGLIDFYAKIYEYAMTKSDYDEDIEKLAFDYKLNNIY